MSLEAERRASRIHVFVVLVSSAAVVSAAPTLRGTRVVLVAVTAEHVPDLRRILATPEVWLRWRDEAASPQWPFDDPSVVRFTVVLEGVVRGMVQYGEEAEPDYRHASIDLFLDPAVHRCGVGRDTVAALARYLVNDRGHHRLVIDPAADNEPAIRCYAARSSHVEVSTSRCNTSLRLTTTYPRAVPSSRPGCFGWESSLGCW